MLVLVPRPARARRVAADLVQQLAVRAASKVVEEAESARVWCVRADDRHASSAWTPASGSAAGVTVVNIDNGFGAAAAAARINLLPPS